MHARIDLIVVREKLVQLITHQLIRVQMTLCAQIIIISIVIIVMTMIMMI